MFNRILIANRGEIARRVARTCRRLNIEYVSVYSAADKNAQHLEGAVETVELGAAAPLESYLNIEKIVKAANTTQCEAVHPGYGFLSENAEFAAAIEAAGLKFIGPSAEAIELLGDKGRAKQFMREAGVPTIPGSATATDDLDQIKAFADEIGFPLLLKPSAGGGGKGMAIVYAANELEDATQQAIRLSEANFSDGRLIVERYVEKPRHIEVQVVGDGNGEAVHVFERECSLQRRHQKVVEEAPSIQLSETTRQEISDAAVRGAKALSYRNAGTFEFVADENGGFYFLEVNTRLQVEHPVSEEIANVDLVEWQLNVAFGNGLPCEQSELSAKGTAIEVRIYAEDPLDEFKPSPGHIHSVAWPADARVECAIDHEGDVPPFYDPMIAKIITHAETRADALAKMQQALSNTRILGVKTNIGFLQSVLSDTDVQSGNIHTSFLDEHSDRLNQAPSNKVIAAIAAASRTFDECLDLEASDPWLSLQGDRGDLADKALKGLMSFWINDEIHHVEVLDHQPDVTVLAIDSEKVEIRNLSKQGEAVLGTINEQDFQAIVLTSEVEGVLTGTHFLAKSHLAHGDAGQNQPGYETAPMPGAVVVISTEVGAQVSKGDALAVIEAMKMEHTVTASTDGVVRQVNSLTGAQVDTGDLLVLIETESE